MWTIAAVNKKINGPLGSYNGLTDVHLAHYFSRPSQQSHLKAVNLISSDGTIIPDNKFKVASLQYEKKKKFYDILANTVIQNAAHKEGSWNKKLCNIFEDVTKMENVEKIKQVGSKMIQRKLPLKETSRTSSSMDPLLYHEIYEWFADQNSNKLSSTFPRSAPSATDYAIKKHRLNGSINAYKEKRCFSAKPNLNQNVPAFMSSPYMYNYHDMGYTSINLEKKKKRRRKKNSNNNIVKPDSADTSSTKMSRLSMPDQSFNCDNCKVTLFYHGHTPFSSPPTSLKEEILIRQQHCGGTPVVVYKGLISPNESLTFISLNHEGFTFSITLFLDGIRYLKLSSCCIYRYAPGKRLGGSSGNFSILNIEGGKLCTKCQYRQVESCSNDLKYKLLCVEKNEPSKTTNFLLDNSKGINETDILNDYNEIVEEQNNVNDENEESSIASEIINSLAENPEVGSNAILENQDEMTDNEAIENSIELDPSCESVIEEDNVSEESSNYSASSQNSPVESIQNVIKEDVLQAIPYQSESSDEEEGVRQHIVLASVHGSPT